MADIDRLIQDLKADDGYALNRQRAIKAADLLQEFSSKVQLLTDYRDMLRREGGEWSGQLVANDLSSVLDGATEPNPNQATHHLVTPAGNHYDVVVEWQGEDYSKVRVISAYQPNGNRLGAVFGVGNDGLNPLGSKEIWCVHSAVPATQCGDYPAPCNCDDPTTHNGH